MRTPPTKAPPRPSRVFACGLDAPRRGTIWENSQEDGKRGRIYGCFARDPSRTFPSSRLPVKTHSSFDAAYFERFYESRASRVYGKAQVSHLARGVTEMIAWFGGELRDVLDVGAGTGLWRDWFR